MGSVCPFHITSIHTYAPRYPLRDQIRQCQCIRILKSNTYGLLSNGEASFGLLIFSDFNNKSETLTLSFS